MIDRLLSRLFLAVYRLDAWFKLHFTPAGALVFGVLLLAGVFGVNTRANLAFQVVGLALALLAVAMASAPFGSVHLRAVRRLPRYASAEQPVRYLVEITNPSRRVQRGLLLVEEIRWNPLGVGEYRHRHRSHGGRKGPFRGLVRYTGWLVAMRTHQGALPRPVPLPDIPPGASVQVEMAWQPLRRGRVRLAGLRVLRPDPLGLFHAVRRLPLPQSLLVLPKRYPVSWEAWIGNVRDRPGGTSHAASTSGFDEFAALREYRPGDPLRHIDWKGWARLGEPIVREYFESCFVRQALVLDTSLPHDAAPARFEAAVSVAASFAAAGPAAMRGALDLLFVGKTLHRVSAGPGLGTADGLLEALACAQARPAETFAALNEAVREHAELLSACVCVLLDWDHERRELVATLRRRGVPLLVLVLGRDSPLEAGPMADQPVRLRPVSVDGVESALRTLAVVPGGAAQGSAA